MDDQGQPRVTVVQFETEERSGWPKQSQGNNYMIMTIDSIKSLMDWDDNVYL